MSARLYACESLAWELEVEPEDGRLVWSCSGEVLSTIGGYAGLFGFDEGKPVDRFLYAMDLRGQLYAAEPNWLLDAEEGRWVWDHASFLSGEPVLCAGDIETDEEGRLLRISNGSSVYLPDTSALIEALAALDRQGLSLVGVLAEIERCDGFRAVVSAPELLARRSADGLCDLGAEIYRRDAMRHAQEGIGRPWEAEDIARFERWIQAGLANPDSFEPRDPRHWSWLARWALEGREHLFSSAGAL